MSNRFALYLADPSRSYYHQHHSQPFYSRQQHGVDLYRHQQPQYTHLDSNQQPWMSPQHYSPQHTYFLPQPALPPISSLTTVPSFTSSNVSHRFLAPPLLSQPPHHCSPTSSSPQHVETAINEDVPKYLGSSIRPSTTKTHGPPSREPTASTAEKKPRTEYKRRNKDNDDPLTSVVSLMCAHPWITNWLQPPLSFDTCDCSENEKGVMESARCEGASWAMYTPERIELSQGKRIKFAVPDIEVENDEKLSASKRDVCTTSQPAELSASCLVDGNRNAEVVPSKGLRVTDCRLLFVPSRQIGSYVTGWVHGDLPVSDTEWLSSIGPSSQSAKSALSGASPLEGTRFVQDQQKGQLLTVTWSSDASKVYVMFFCSATDTRTEHARSQLDLLVLDGRDLLDAVTKLGGLHQDRRESNSRKSVELLKMDFDGRSQVGAGHDTGRQDINSSVANNVATEVLGIKQLDRISLRSTRQYSQSKDNGSCDVIYNSRSGKNGGTLESEAGSKEIAGDVWSGDGNPRKRKRVTKKRGRGGSGAWDSEVGRRNDGRSLEEFNLDWTECEFESVHRRLLRREDLRDLGLESNAYSERRQWQTVAGHTTGIRVASCTDVQELRIEAVAQLIAVGEEMRKAHMWGKDRCSQDEDEKCNKSWTNAAHTAEQSFETCHENGEDPDTLRSPTCIQDGPQYDKQKADRAWNGETTRNERTSGLAPHRLTCWQQQSRERESHIVRLREYARRLRNRETARISNERRKTKTAHMQEEMRELREKLAIVEEKNKVLEQRNLELVTKLKSVEAAKILGTLRLSIEG